MPRQSSSKSPQRDDAVDLSTIFIGRQQQLDLFEIYLHRWKNLIFDADPDQPIVPVAPSPNTKLQGLLVLLYGRGGFGKSTLLRHYRSIVLQENRNPLISKVTVSEIIDWEFSVEGKRSLFNLPQGQEVDAHEYYEVLCGQFAIALGRKPAQFHEYQSARSAVAQARKEAVQLLGSLKNDDRYAELRNMSVDGVMTALSVSTPPPISTIASNKTVQGATREGTKLLGELLAQLKQRLHDRLGEKLGDFLDPALRLGLALGRDLSLFARDFPLVMFHDTYEEIDEGDRLLRIVMGAAGLRVGWVIAGRDNLWAGAGQIERSITLEYGYKEIVPSDRGLAVDFNVGGVGAFTVSDIKDYFDLLCNKVDYIPPLPMIAAEEAKRILDVTKGVPLAVKIAAGLYLDTADLDTITEQVEGKREIVDQMVRRYLLHARDDQSERAKLYGLAMLRRADQPMAVAAALGLTSEQVKTSYAKELSLLHRRYSFIFTEKEEPSLHQEVRTFLRLWLLERYDEPEIQAINERLKAAHETSLSRLENSRNYGNLKARFEDEQWVGTYVDLTEQQFWLDPVEGVQYAVPFMIAGNRYGRFALREITDIGEFFEAKIGSPYIDWWTGAKKALSASGFQLSREQEHLLYTLLGQTFGFPLLKTDYHDEIEALLWWNIGDAYQYNNEQNALQWYEKALTRLGQETSLREATAQAYQRMAERLYEKKNYTECLPLFTRAIELNSNSALLYNYRGMNYDNLWEYQLAIEDYNRAIELDPGSAAICYRNRCISYNGLKEYQLALEDSNQAIQLDPKHSKGYTRRGNSYGNLKEYQLAIEDYNRAIELDPGSAEAYNSRGYTYLAFKEYQLALEDFNRAIELDPMSAYGYNHRGDVYRRVLKEYEQAMADYNRALELDPRYAYSYNNRGIVYLVLKEYEQAMADFNCALELIPKFVSVYHNRGLVYLYFKDKERAMSEFHRRWNSNPPNVNAATMVIWANMNKERPGLEVANQLDEAASIDPQHHGAYVCRGIALGLCGKIKQGLENLEKAIQIEPEEWDAYFWKGMLCAYYYPGRYQIAIEAIEKSLIVGEGLPPVLLTPLYWLERDRSDFFHQFARPLLKKYGM